MPLPKLDFEPEVGKWYDMPDIKLRVQNPDGSLENVTLRDRGSWRIGNYEKEFLKAGQEQARFNAASLGVTVDEFVRRGLK